MICSIQSCSQEPDLIRPKNACMIVICFLQAPSNLENHMTVCMGYPAMTPKGESRKTPLEGGRKSMQRERHKKTNSISERMVCL